MQALRALILGNSRAAILLVVLALCVKALIPAGYMVAGGSKSITVTICDGGGDGGPSLAMIEIPAKGSPPGGKDGHGKNDGGQCSFSSLSMAAMGGADAPLLALALAFILLLGLCPAACLPFQRADYLQPPLRGPPATA